MFFGKWSKRIFDFFQNGADKVSAAEVFGLCGRVDVGCVYVCGRDIDRKTSGYEAEICFADRECGCENGLGFVRSDCGLSLRGRLGENRLFADLNFLSDSGADWIGKEALRNGEALWKSGLLPKSGREGLDSGLFGAFGAGLFNGRFDLIGEASRFLPERSGFLQNIFGLLQGKKGWTSPFDLWGIPAEFQRAGILPNRNFDAGIERLGAAAEGHGADLLNAVEKMNGMENGRLSLLEEPAISPEEIRRIRRAIVTEHCAEPVKAEIRVDMSGMKNIINKETDIDSIVTDLTAAVSEAVASAAEGLHKL